MKKIYFYIKISALILLPGTIKAQQEPMFTHYMFNTMSMNPAYAGTQNALSVTGISRYQWVGIEGAPHSYNLAIHAPVSSKNIGIGFTLITDEIGPLRNTYFTLNYAYRLMINEAWTLSMGLKAGFNNFYLGLSDVTVNEVSDPNFYNDTRKMFAPNAGAGAYLYNKDFYFGVAAPKLFETKIESGTKDENNLKRHYFIVSGYEFYLNPELKLKPSTAVKIVEGAPISVDLTSLFVFRDRFIVGPSYRFGDALGIIFDVQLSRQLTLGYSFDYSVNSLRSYNKGSHEILISCNMDGFMNKKVKSPRYF
jgi:type IX secretion system PorP/SprF family membrane protein